MVRPVREIDKPFRFTWDFCLVWALFFIVALYMVPQSKGAHAYERPLLALMVAVFATFLLYGPVLLVRQIFASGSRGGFVARALVSVLLAQAFAALGSVGDCCDCRRVHMARRSVLQARLLDDDCVYSGGRNRDRLAYR